MERTLKIPTVLLFVIGALCGLQRSYAALNYGIFETYVVLNANGGGNVFYDAGATTANPNFHGANLGTFNPSLNSLILNGGEVKTYKNGGGDVTGAFLDYRIWLTGNESGSFIERSIPFNANLGGGDQRWQLTGDNINVLNGLSSGNYMLGIYFRASGNQGDVFDNRGGPNYEAAFSVVPEPVNIALSVFGSLLIGGGVWQHFRKARTASSRG
jgi:hypothetical protein